VSVVNDKACGDVYIYVTSQLVTDAQFTGIAKDVYEEGIFATPQTFSKPKRNIRTLHFVTSSLYLYFELPH